MQRKKVNHKYRCYSNLHPHLSQGRHKKDIVPLFCEEKKVLGLAAEDRLYSRARF